MATRPSRCAQTSTPSDVHGRLLVAQRPHRRRPLSRRRTSLTVRREPTTASRCWPARRCRWTSTTSGWGSPPRITGGERAERRPQLAPAVRLKADIADREVQRAAARMRGRLRGRLPRLRRRRRVPLRDGAPRRRRSRSTARRRVFRVRRRRAASTSRTRARRSSRTTSSTTGRVRLRRDPGRRARRRCPRSSRPPAGPEGRDRGGRRRGATPACGCAATGGAALAAAFPPYPLEEKATRDRDVKVVRAADYIAVTKGTRTYPWRVLGDRGERRAS